MDIQTDQSNSVENYFGYQYVKGSDCAYRSEGKEKLILIENSKEIFYDIEKERSKEQQNSDLLFQDYNSSSVDSFAHNLEILNFE